MVIRDLRILGLIERGRRGIDLLADAVTIGLGGRRAWSTCMR